MAGGDGAGNGDDGIARTRHQTWLFGAGSFEQSSPIVGNASAMKMEGVRDEMGGMARGTTLRLKKC